MFEDLYDSLSLLWSWRWPSVEGKITAVDVERIQHYRQGERLRLAIAYKFSIGDDGPYTGESFWEPSFSFRAKERVVAARHKMRTHGHVLVRYRADDPSVNRLDSANWQDL
jgi:hypothetical protein